MNRILKLKKRITKCNLICFVFLLSIFSNNVWAQSSSSFVVNASNTLKGIQNDKNQINELSSKLTKEENEIFKLKAGIEDEIKNQKDARIKEKIKELENSTSWKNRLKTANRGYVEYNPGTCSAGGPPPICIVKHWYRSSREKAMKEFKKYSDSVIDEFERNFKPDIESIKRKIRYKEKQITSMKSKQTDLEYDIEEKKRKISNTANAWSEAIKKANEVKEENWLQEVNKEKVNEKVLNEKLSSIEKVINKFQQNSDKEISSKIKKLRNKKIEDSKIDELKVELEKASALKNKLLQQERLKITKEIGRHNSIVNSKIERRRYELQNWNKKKETEISKLNDICRNAGASCGSIYSPLSYLPEADIDVVNQVFKDLPSEDVVSEFADEILKVPAGVIPTYKVKKSGTQHNFESKMGIRKFLDLKASFSDDPLDSNYGMDIKMCLELIGKSSCVGVRKNKNTGYDELYLDGILNDQANQFKEQMKSYNEQIMKSINKTKNN